MNKRYYKYLTTSQEDIKWGIYLTGVGHIKVDKGTNYPLTDDPSHHYFHWSTGRRLCEYQILYITKGQGVFESEATGQKKVKAGDIIILFPNIWHRFKPDKKTGWDEYWVEFKGILIEHFRLRDFLRPEQAIISIGIHDDLANNYINIINLVKNETPGFQYVISGILIQILGQIIAIKKYHPFEGREIEIKIKQAKLIILENIETPVQQEEISRRIGMGYSLYRKRFKEYTGISPAQYQIQLRIKKAMALLITSKLSLKEIAYRLSFDSLDYFCRVFKQKTGITPSTYREINQKQKRCS